MIGRGGGCKAEKDNYCHLLRHHECPSLPPTIYLSTTYPGFFSSKFTTVHISIFPNPIPKSDEKNQLKIIADVYMKNTTNSLQIALI